MYLVTAKEMQKMDFMTIESFGLPGRILMENAGKGAARFFCKFFSGSGKKKVGIFAGRGNNGGDGFVIARYIAENGFNVTVYLLAKKERVKGDAKANLDLLALLNIPVVEIADKACYLNHKNSMIHQDIWIDAILGTGLQSDIKGFFKIIIEFINSFKKFVFAVDIPSGLNAETGNPCGVCVKADATATFAFAKTGHFLFSGADCTGKLKVIDIGIPSYITEQVKPQQYLLTRNYIKNHIIKRSEGAHKGDAGHLLVIAGSVGKTGAAALTATSAMRAGAGLVSLAVPDSVHVILEGLVIESMTHILPESQPGVLDMRSFEKVMELLSNKKCLALGPGLGTNVETKKFVCRLILESSVPVIIDADGLNSLVGNLEVLQKINVPVILTPHPGEMARLVGETPDKINRDRIGYARKFAVRYNVCLVLKGAKTVIANPDGMVYVNSTGNSGMASGGMGDVLTGIIAGLVTQGYSPEIAAQAGVFLHGDTADELFDVKGPVGYLASEVMASIPSAFARISS